MSERLTGIKVQEAIEYQLLHPEIEKEIRVPMNQEMLAVFSYHVGRYLDRYFQNNLLENGDESERKYMLQEEGNTYTLLEQNLRNSVREFQAGIKEPQIMINGRDIEALDFLLHRDSTYDDQNQKDLYFEQGFHSKKTEQEIFGEFLVRFREASGKVSKQFADHYNFSQNRPFFIPDSMIAKKIEPFA